MNTLPASFLIQDEVKRALRLNQPVVALETTVVTHGLPAPTNLSLARDMQAAARGEGAIPATVAVLDGVIRVGLTDDELVALARAPSAMKISRRDFAAAIAKKASGGTTVAGTMFAAHKVGIQVFATGGIGGVHRGAAAPRDRDEKHRQQEEHDDVGLIQPVAQRQSGKCRQRAERDGDGMAPIEFRRGHPDSGCGK